MYATFDHIEQEAPTIYTFFFKPEKPLRYDAGQFTELTIHHDNPDERGIRRWLTLSSKPSDDLFSITTRIVPDSSSYKKTLQTLQKNTQVVVSEPMGDFVLPKDESIPLVFVAAGVGITPFHSMVTHLHETKHRRPIKFIHAVKNEDDIIFQKSFDATGLHTTIVVEKPSVAWGGERGVLTGEHIVKITEPSQKSLFYVAGPEHFAERLQKELLALTIPRNQIVVDFFSGYSTV